MAYTKTNWVNNSSPYINADNLNNIENGIKNNETAIDELSTTLNGIKGTILWENQSPTQSFASQNITLNSSDYDMILWVFKHFNNADELITGYSIKGYGIRCMTIPGDGVTRRRNVNYVSDTTYTVGDAVKSDGTVETNALIPFYAIGITTGLF